MIDPEESLGEREWRLKYERCEFFRSKLNEEARAALKEAGRLNAEMKLGAAILREKEKQIGAQALENTRLKLAQGCLTPTGEVYLAQIEELKASQASLRRTVQDDTVRFRQKDEKLADLTNKLAAKELERERAFEWGRSLQHRVDQSEAKLQAIAEIIHPNKG